MHTHTSIHHFDKEKGQRYTDARPQGYLYTRNTDDAATTGLGRKTSRRGLTRSRSSLSQRRITSDFTNCLKDLQFFATMSFRAPISKQHSRLAPAWSTLLDPPQLPRAVALPLCVVNIFVPGVGTMVAGAMTDKMDTFLIGALQLLTSVVLIGWLWSVIWGVEMVNRSLRRGAGEAADMVGPGGAATDNNGWDTSPQDV